MRTRFHNFRLPTELSLPDIAEFTTNDGIIESIRGGISAQHEIDLGGKYIYPAFVDGHAHPLFAGREALGPQVTQCQNIAEIQQVLREYRANNPDQSWVTGGSYDRNLTDGGRFLAQWIDEAIADVPVVLHAADHHTIWVNSMALSLLPKILPALNAGSIDVDNQGNPTGVLREPEAMNLVLNLAPKLTLAEEINALCWADRQLASLGIVAVQDAWITAGMTEVYLEAIHKDALLLDYNLAFKIDPANWKAAMEFAIEDRAKVVALASKQLTAKTVKIFADGVFGSATASLLDPYENSPDWLGEPLWSDSQLMEAALACAMADFQLHIHAIGDAGVRQALNAIEFVQQRLGKPPLPHVIAHLELVHPDDLPRFAQLGVIANMQPVWAQPDGMMQSCIPRLGQRRVDLLYRMRDLIDSGADLAFGSDWPVSSADPLLGIATAVNRQTVHGNPPGGWTPEQAIPVAEAIRAASEVADYQLSGNREQFLGVGSRANFLTLNKDLREIRGKEIQSQRVQEVFKRGERIYRAETI